MPRIHIYSAHNYGQSQDISRNFRNRVRQTVLSAGRVSQSFTTRMRHFAPAAVSATVARLRIVFL